MKTLKKVLILCLLVAISLTTFAACSNSGQESAKQDIEFTVTYSLNTSDPTAKFTPNQYVQQVNKYLNPQMLIEPSKPTRTGYDFLGWFYDEEGTKEVNFNWDPKFSKDTTLYAKWIAQESYGFEFYCKDAARPDYVGVVPVELGEKYFVDDVIPGNKISEGYNAFKDSYSEYLVGRGLDKNFYAYNADLSIDPFKLTISSDLVVSRELQQYAVREENHYIIKFYVHTYEKDKSIRFLNKNKQICKVPCDVLSGQILFDKAKVVDTNGNESAFTEFVVVDGKKVMPKMDNLLEDYQLFSRWQVTTNDGLYFYDYYGRKINNKFKLVDANGNEIEDTEANKSKFVYFVDTLTYKDIVDINLKTNSKEYNIQYIVTLPDESGNLQEEYLLNDGTTMPVEKANNLIAGQSFSNKEEKYNYIEKTLNIKVGKLIWGSGLILPDKEVRNLYAGAYTYDWAYYETYASMKVTKGDLVNVRQDRLKEDIVLVTVCEKKKIEVSFERGDNEYFNTADQSTSTTITFPLDELNNILLNPEENIGQDFKSQVGHMYYILPGKTTPHTNAQLSNIEIQLINEREINLLKSHYKLRGFCLAEDKSKGQQTIEDQDLLVIKVVDEVGAEGKVTRKFVLRDIDKETGLKPKEDQRTIVLKPVFMRSSEVKVNIDLSEVKKNESAYIDPNFPEFIKASLNKPTVPNISSLNSLIQIPGYKFSKWVTVKTPFDTTLKQKNEIDEVIGEYDVSKFYQGIEFNDDYCVLGETTIKPVFDKDLYTLEFLNDAGTNLLDKNKQIKSDIDELTVKKEQIEKILNMQSSLVVNKPENERHLYEFDNWYATIDGKKVTLEKFLSDNNVDMKAPSYEFNLDRNVTFKAEFKYIEYKIIFNEFDTYETKETITYKPSNTTVLFNKEGVISKDREKFENYSYKPVDFEYTTKLGVKKNYVIGWYYEKYNKDKKVERITLQANSNITADTAILDKENKILNVYPILKEYNVTINAGKGYFDNKDQTGTIDTANPTKATVGNLKGGYFGFEMYDSNKENLRIPEGYSINDEHMFTYNIWVEEVIDGKKVSVNKVITIKDNKVAKVNADGTIDQLRITDDIEFTYSYKPINHKVTVIFYDIKDDVVTSQQLNLTGNIENIFDDSNKIYELQDIIDIALAPYSPKKSYYTYIYELTDDNTEDYIIDHTYENPYNSFRNAKRDRVIYVKIRYDNLHLTLDANGGKYVGGRIDQDLFLETYIDKDSALTINKDGVLTHDSTAYSAYVTKNQENLQEKKIDQGPPQRDGYVFAGFAASKNAKFGVDKFYYGYRDHSDIKDFDTIFTGQNIMWLGDATPKEKFTNFIDYATNDLIMVEMEGNEITKFTMKALYAQWIPIRITVDYYRADGKKLIDLDKEIFNQNKFGQKTAGWKEYLSPEDVILNPYRYASKTSAYINSQQNQGKDILINWKTEKDGVFIERKDGDTYHEVIKAAKYDEFDINTAKIGQDQDGFFYTSHCKVIEAINTGIEFKYEVDYQNHGVENFASDEFLINPHANLTSYPMVIAKGQQNKYVAKRHTYAINGKIVDSLYNNQTYQPAQFNKNNFGELVEENGIYYYKYKLNALEVMEEMPIYVDVTYINENRPDIVRRTGFNDPMINPYYNEKEMATYDEKGNVVDYNYYKSVLVRPYLEKGQDGNYTGNILIEKAVWKSVGNEVVMETNPFGPNKESKIICESTSASQYIGQKITKKPKVQKVDKTYSIILETSVYADWIKDDNLTNKLSLKVTYNHSPKPQTVENADGTSKTIYTYTQLKNNEIGSENGMFFQTLKSVTIKDKVITGDNNIKNPTDNEFKFKLIKDQYFVGKQQFYDYNKMIRSWTAGGVYVDKLQIAENGIDRKMVPNFDVIKYLSTGTFIKGKRADSSYYIQIDTYESYQVYNTEVVQQKYPDDQVIE